MALYVASTPITNCHLKLSASLSVHTKIAIIHWNGQQDGDNSNPRPPAQCTKGECLFRSFYLPLGRRRGYSAERPPKKFRLLPPPNHPPPSASASERACSELVNYITTEYDISHHPLCCCLLFSHDG